MAIEVFLPIVGIVGMLMLGIILLTYLASRALKVAEWEAYLNIELQELFLSFIILIIAIGWYEAMNSIAIGLYVGGPAPPANALSMKASEFLQEMLEEGVLPGMLDTFKLQTCLSIWNMFSRRIGEFVLTVSYKLFPGIDSFLQMLNVVGFGLVAAYGSLSVQLAGLQVIDATMMNFFLPAGIILRFFPPTREAGAFLISFAIGFGIVFPTTYVIHKQVFEEMKIDVYDPPTAEVWATCQAQIPVAGAINSFLIANLPLGVRSLVQPLFTTTFSEFSMNVFTSAWFANVLEGLAALSLPALWLPALSITITIAFISATTKFILMKL